MDRFKGYDLIRTCSACPEQYDVEKNGTTVGYLRLRHGYFHASYPDVSGMTIYKAEPKGDGIFEPEERDYYLKKAITAIHHYRKEHP